MPSSKRPPLITSRVAPILARSAGERKRVAQHVGAQPDAARLAAHAVIVVHDSRMSLVGIGNGEQVIDEVDGVKAEVVADPRGLRDARPPVVGLAQERAEANRASRRLWHGGLPAAHDGIVAAE